jgi:hypothetical protein
MPERKAHKTKTDTGNVFSEKRGRWDFEELA